LSFSRVVLIPIFIYFLSRKTFDGCLIALIVFIFASFTDMLDGWSARKLKQESEFGAFIDPLADKCLVISAIIAIIILDSGFEIFDMWMIFIIAGRDFLLTYMRMLAIKKNKQLRTSRLGKIKTAFQMISIVIIIMIYMAKRGKIFAAHESIPYWIMLAVTIFTAISGIRYLYTNWELFIPTKIQQKNQQKKEKI
jgi:cardiolipin synthase